MAQQLLHSHCLDIARQVWESPPDRRRDAKLVSRAGRIQEERVRRVDQAELPSENGTLLETKPSFLGKRYFFQLWLAGLLKNSYL